MKNEIKEMLELFGSTDENIMFGDIVELNSKQSHLLLDYITNLQQENKQLKEKIDILLEDNNQLEEIRIKAIEYIKHENFKRNILLGLSEKKYVRDILNNVLEILGDKENE